MDLVSDSYVVLLLLWGQRRWNPVVVGRHRENSNNGPLAEAITEGGLDRTYPLTEAAKAISYLEEGHARGKVVIII